MKKKIAVFAMFLLGTAVLAPMAFAKDTMIDKAGDWFAALGKPKNEKNTILAQRRLNRAAQEIGRGLQRAGRDMEKAFEN